MKVILDCNIYDKLSERFDLFCLIQELVQGLKLSVLVTPSLLREIKDSPHLELAKSIPVTFIGESVMRAGGQVGDRTGSGNLYRAHYGDSSQFNDALIADAAQHDADFLVTEDGRCRKRMNKFAVRGRAITFSEFEREVISHVGGT